MLRRPLPAAILGGLAIVASLGAHPLQAQEDCEFREGTENVTGFGGNTYFRRPRLACDNGRLTVSADSAISYGGRRYEFFGNTRLENADIRLVSNNAQYDAANDRITAHGRVSLLKKAEGDSIAGENLDYTPATDTTKERLVVTGNRPHAVLRPRSSGGRGAGAAATPAGGAASNTPYTIDAERITVEGSDFTGEGRVEIRRDDVEAYADSVLYLGDAGQMALSRSARLKTDESELTGRFILLTMQEGDIREALVRGDGVMSSEDVKLTGDLIVLTMQDGDLREADVNGDAAMMLEDASLTAPSLRIQLSDGQLQKLWAGRGTPEATAAPAAGPGADAVPAAPQAVLITADFNVKGDSLTILAPASRLDTIRAMGRARITSLAADSLERAELPPAARSDWIEGDTVLAVFAEADSAVAGAATPPASAADTADAADQRIELLRAWGRPNPTRAGASALYLMEPADTAAARRGERAISHLRADTIEVSFDEGEVRTLHGQGNVQGLQLEPMRPSDSTPATPAGQPAPGTPAAPGAGAPTVPPPAGNSNPGSPGPLSPRPPRGPEPHR